MEAEGVLREVRINDPCRSVRQGLTRSHMLRKLSSSNAHLAETPCQSVPPRWTVLGADKKWMARSLPWTAAEKFPNRETVYVDGLQARGPVEN